MTFRSNAAAAAELAHRATAIRAGVSRGSSLSTVSTEALLCLLDAADELLARLDSQERIEADSSKGRDVYWGCVRTMCTDCPSRICGKTPRAHYGTDSCADAQTLDMLRRQRLLDRRGRS